MASERPILFTDPMVRAILEGRKTVTRRVGPTWANVQPGTVLWVRECFALPRNCKRMSPAEAGQRAIHAGYGAPWAPVWWRADAGYNHAIPERDAEDEWGGPGRWRPSIHMPRWACRLRLEVESVMVEPSDECLNTLVETASDRLRCSLNHCPSKTGCHIMPMVTEAEAQLEGFDSRAEFLELWRKIHTYYNGPVYRVAFRRM